MTPAQYKALKDKEAAAEKKVGGLLSTFRVLTESNLMLERVSCNSEIS